MFGIWNFFFELHWILNAKGQLNPAGANQNLIFAWVSHLTHHIFSHVLFFLLQPHFLMVFLYPTSLKLKWSKQVHCSFFARTTRLPSGLGACWDWSSCEKNYGPAFKENPNPTNSKTSHYKKSLRMQFTTTMQLNYTYMRGSCGLFLLLADFAIQPNPKICEIWGCCFPACGPGPWAVSWFCIIHFELTPTLVLKSKFALHLCCMEVALDLDPCHSSLSTSSKHTLTVQGKEPLLSTHPVAVINL